MRFGQLVVIAAATSAILFACGSDGTSAVIPAGARTGLNGDQVPGPPGEPSGSQGADSGEVARNSPTDASADAAEPQTLTGPTSESDAGTTPDTGVEKAPSVTTDAGVGGCACGCADGCLTELITGCEAPTAVLAAVCPKVPTTCACNANCAVTPAEPSLTDCVALFLLTGG